MLLFRRKQKSNELTKIEEYNKRNEQDNNDPIMKNINGDSKLRFEAMGYAQINDLPKVIECCNKAIKINPRGAFNYFLMGRTLGDLGYYDSAIINLTKAIELDGGFADAYTQRGRIKHILCDYEGAENDFSKAIELDPFDKEPLRFRGQIKMDLFDYEGAIHDFEIALKLPIRKHPKELRVIMQKGYQDMQSDLKKAINSAKGEIQKEKDKEILEKFMGREFEGD